MVRSLYNEINVHVCTFEPKSVPKSENNSISTYKIRMSIAGAEYILV